MLLKNSFSWSFSRYNLFRYCERAYFYHYYGSWNGWDTYAPMDAKEAFKLKHLISKELWLNIILKKSLLNTINSKSFSKTNFAAKFKYESHRVFSSEISSLYSEEWKNDPKIICIDEIYYKESSLNQVIDWIRNYLSKRINILQQSKLFSEFDGLPYPAFVNTESPLTFTINDIPVWFSPDLIWAHQGKINILNLNNSFGWSLLASLNMIYAEQNYNYQPADIVCHSLFIDQDSSFSVYAVRSKKEVIEIITDSSKEMRSRLTFDQKAYIENFSKTIKQKKCRTCCFREICMKTPE